MSSVRFVRLNPRTGQLDPIPPSQTPTQAQIQEQAADRWRAGFSEVTPALILTGLFIGIASGLGSTVGTALGALIVDRFVPPPRSAARRRG